MVNSKSSGEMSIQDNLPISGLTCWIGGGVCRSAVRSTGSKPDLGEGWEIPKLKPHALASQNDRTLGNQGWAGSTHAERVPVLLASFCCVLPETPPPPNPQLKSKHFLTNLYQTSHVIGYTLSRQPVPWSCWGLWYTLSPSSLLEALELYLPSICSS